MRRQSAPEGKDRLLSSCDPTEPDSVVTTIVTSVAQLRDERAESLEPLDASIDSDALAELFTPALSGDHRGPGRVDFTYAGCSVTLTSDGQIVVTRS